MKIVNTSKAMEKLSNLGITMECVSSDKMQTLKASCTANTDIKNVYCADYAEKKHLEKIAAIEKHIAHVKANITPVKKIECVYCADRADMQKKKKYHAYLEKMFNADNKATDPKTEKKSTVIPTSPEKAKAISEKAKADYKKSVELDKAIKERKPEKANIYSCNVNTLATSIDYTTTDLKDLERLNTKKAKIENTLDTFELLEKSKIENDVEKIKRKAVKRTSKNIQKCSNKRLKEITDNAREIIKHNAELTATAKNMTSRTEYISYSKKFKKAFRNVVDIEYNENCLDVSAKLSALHEKQKRLDEKRKQLKAKISACDSVIKQLEKTDENKINYALIDSKLDVIGIGLTEYSLTEMQAVKTSVNTTLTNVNAAIGNILDDIKALSNLETAYTKIKTGKEILIDVTTKDLDKNVNFAVVVGYDIKENNSTYAILHIRQLTEKTLESMNLKDCIIDINYNIFRNPSSDVKLALSRQITKRQAYNMIARQGSKTQYNIYHCAMRNDFNDHDTSDIYSTAYTQIENALSVKNAADIVKAKKVINALNAKIQHLNPDIDGYIINKYVKTANAVLKDVYKIAFVVADNDYKTNKSFITVLENMYTAISEKSVKALKTSCYNKINAYLTSIRAIREKSDIANIDSVINSESERFYTLFEDNQEVEYSEKSIILKKCYAEMKKCLNESAAKTFNLMSKGYSEAQISEKRKISKPAISEQITEIKQAFIKCYTDIKNNENNKELFKNKPIIFDPSVFDDCKTISEKSGKIITTYQKKTEIDRIKNAVSEMPLTEYECMKYNFKKFLDGFNPLQRQIYIKLLENNTSDRKIADYFEIKRDRVKDLREKIIKTIQKIIEEYTTITIDKSALKKTPLSVYVNFFAIA